MGTTSEVVGSDEEPKPIPSFKPSDVMLIVPPLAGTMKRSEYEAAATLLVRACQFFGDKWQALRPTQIGETIKADIEFGAEPLTSLKRNPFFRPDFHGLVKEGFAIFTEEEGLGPIAFTEKGIEALRRWVRR